MLCPKCNTEITNKGYTVKRIIHICDKCGHRVITDYEGKEISTEEKLRLEDIYNG